MHRPALRMLSERFDVRAIYSSVAKLAENAVSEFQADPVDSYQSMVHRDDIDAVLILERSWLRFLPAMAACRAGKAVYWAGCLDLDPQSDIQFKTCVEESGVAFMAGLPRRYAPATLRLKELIATHLGPPRLIFCHKRLSIDGRSSANGSLARRDAESRLGDGTKVGPDEIQNLAMRTELIELIDWCCYVVAGRPVSVVSANQPSCFLGDYQALSLAFDRVDAEGNGRATANPVTKVSQNGHSAVGQPGHAEDGQATAQISCGSYIPSRWQEAIGFRPPAAMQVCCQRGVAFVDLPGTLVWFDDAGRHQESLEMESPVGEKMLSQFHRAVTSLVRNLCGLDDAYRAAAILKAAQSSNTQGQRVELSSSADQSSLVVT